MNALSEREVRDQLASALEQLDPPPPALDELRASAKRRTKRFRWGGAGVLAVAAAAMVAVLVIVIPDNGGDRAPVRVASLPSRASLVDFAHTHGGVKIAGPIAPDPVEPGSQLPLAVGAFTTKKAILFAEYFQNGGWALLDSYRVTSLGPGKFVTRIDANHLVAPYSFSVRIIGGDVSYFGAVIRYDFNRQAWTPARFGTCGHDKLCYGGTTEPYGHPDRAGFVSIANICTPNCAAGHDYRIQWRWAKTHFVAVSETPISS